MSEHDGTLIGIVGDLKQLDALADAKIYTVDVRLRLRALYDATKVKAHETMWLPTARQYNHQCEGIAMAAKELGIDL